MKIAQVNPFTEFHLGRLWGLVVQPLDFISIGFFELNALRLDHRDEIGAGRLQLLAVCGVGDGWGLKARKTVFGRTRVIVAGMQAHLLALGSWVLVAQGAIFVACVLLFRRSIDGELSHKMRCCL